jgi:hypothetical protein
MGRASRRLARTLSQGAPVHAPRCFPRGKDPSTLTATSGHPPRQPTRAHHAPYPCALLTAPTTRGPSLSHRQRCIGVLPLPCLPPQEGKRGRVCGGGGYEWEGGSGAERRFIDGAPGAVGGSRTGTPSRGSRSEPGPRRREHLPRRRGTSAPSR